MQLVAGAVAAFLLAVALGAGGALAAVGLLDDDDEPEAVEARTELDDERLDSSDSLRRVLEFLVDEAVEAGRLTEEEGAELKEHLEAGAPPFGPRSFGRDFFRGRGPDFFGGFRALPFFRPALDLEVAADYLGLTRSELRRELADGRTLAELARAGGKPVEGLVDVLVGAAVERIDDAVADGRLSEERGAELKADVEERIEDGVDEELRGFELFRLSDLWRELERFGKHP